jgi:hypothetical protein
MKNPKRSLVHWIRPTVVVALFAIGLLHTTPAFAVADESMTPGSTTTDTSTTTTIAKPDRLFDITLKVDTPTTSSVKDLKATVFLTNFGRLETAVAMKFAILNPHDDVVWQGSADDTISVETEATFHKDFKDNPELPPGRYALRLHTIYNTNVEDDFTEGFTIEQPGHSSANWIFPVVLVLIVGGISVVLTRDKKHSKKQPSRTQKKTAKPKSSKPTKHKR